MRYLFVGWFALAPQDKDTQVPSYSNIATLAISDTDKFLISGCNTVNSFQIIKNKDEEIIVNRNLLPGDVFKTGKVFLNSRKINSGLFKKNKTKEEFYLKCTDTIDREVFIPYDAEGVFIPISRGGNRVLMQLPDIIRSASLPCMVKLVYGSEPGTPSPFSGLIHLKSASKGTCVTASTILNLKNIFLEFNVNVQVKLQIAENYHDLDKNPQFNSIMKVCHYAAESYGKGIKTSYMYFSNEKGKDESMKYFNNHHSSDSTESPCNTTLKPGSMIDTAPEDATSCLRHLCCNHHNDSILQIPQEERNSALSSCSTGHYSTFPCTVNTRAETTDSSCPEITDIVTTNSDANVETVTENELAIDTNLPDGANIAPETGHDERHKRIQVKKQPPPLPKKPAKLIRTHASQSSIIVVSNTTLIRHEIINKEPQVQIVRPQLPFVTQALRSSVSRHEALPTPQPSKPACTLPVITESILHERKRMLSKQPISNTKSNMSSASAQTTSYVTSKAKNCTRTLPPVLPCRRCPVAPPRVDPLDVVVPLRRSRKSSNDEPISIYFDDGYLDIASVSTGDNNFSRRESETSFYLDCEDGRSTCTFRLQRGNDASGQNDDEDGLPLGASCSTIGLDRWYLDKREIGRPGTSTKNDTHNRTTANLTVAEVAGKLESMGVSAHVVNTLRILRVDGNLLRHLDQHTLRDSIPNISLIDIRKIEMFVRSGWRPRES